MSLFFFFKQKTAYEMRISDWSSDVCSSDLQRVIELALDPVMQGQPGVVESMRHMMVEIRILLRFDLGFRPRPKGTGGIERLGPVAILQQHQQGDMVGIGLDDMAQTFGFEELVFARAQMQGDGGAATRTFGFTNGELA